MQKFKQSFKNRLTKFYGDGEINIFFEMILESFGFANSNSNNQIKLTEQQLNRFEQYKNRLLDKEPIQYILQQADFYGLKFKVNPSVLIPRPETEELVHLIINEQKNKSIRLLDIGTGSGCIPITLQKKLSKASISTIDISTNVIAIAKENATKNKVEIDFFIDDALNLKPDNYPVYDVIVSNPPYIGFSELYGMDENVKAHEPHLALFVNDDEPLIFYDKISNFAITNLSEKGTLYFEINQNLSKETKALLHEKGFDAQIIKDINNNDRIIKAQLRG